ncbi:MAG TPA: MlaD family protein [Candidatus Dormibacteraeota bacterium]|jgi:phospholipid/cholesterol/gamma-HCH transport system substrate-binding protein|nr:MlaD family protein [Candidatus Dormibacteraeota bacterium]
MTAPRGPRGPRIRTRLYPVLLTRIPPLWAGVVGAVIIVVILYLVFAVSLAQGNPYAHRYSVHTRFPNTINLGTNDFAEIHGVRVGRVGDLTPVDGLADAVLRIDDPGVRLHDDATATVRLKSLVGESYVEVDPGTPSRPELADGALLPPGRTASPVQLDQVLNTLDPATRSALAGLLTQLGTGVNGRAGDIAGLVRQSESTLGSTGASVHAFDSPQLGELLATLRTDTGVLADRSAALTGIFRSGNSLLGVLASDTATLQAVIGDAADTFGRLDAVLHDRTRGLGATLAELDAVTRNTGALADQARPIVDAMTPQLPSLALWMKELASATGQLDANGYFLRLLTVVGPDSPSGAGGAQASQSRAASRGAVPARPGAPLPPGVSPAPSSVLTGMLDLVYGG